MRISDWSADVCSSDLKVIAPLTNPAPYGGNPRDAFHVIAPSIPGYGFSDAPTGTGWGVERIAQTWIALIRRLGYDRFVAQGGDSSEERRVGKECVSTCRSRWSPYH